MRTMLHCNRPKGLTYREEMPVGEEDGNFGIPNMWASGGSTHFPGDRPPWPSSGGSPCGEVGQTLLAGDLVDFRKVFGGEFPGNSLGIGGDLFGLGGAGNDARDQRAGCQPAHGKFEDRVTA